MSFSYEEILRANFQRIDEEQAAASAALEASRLSGDAYAVNVAADEILNLDMKRQALSARAHTFVNSQQQRPQGNQFGLNSDEVDVAHAIGSGDASLTDQERERIYAEQRYKLRAMRQSGAYRDDQGTSR